MNIYDFAGVKEPTSKKVLIDFSHLSHRNLYIAKLKVDQMSKSMYSFNGDLSDYHMMIEGDELKNAAMVDMWFHLMLKSIMLIKRTHEAKAEDVILCLDDRSWRKKYYKGYKAHRQSEKDKTSILFEGFYKNVNTLLDFFGLTKINILQTKDAEADDLLYVVSKILSESNVMCVAVTSDKDLKQILRFSNVKMYDPLAKDFIKDWKPEDLLKHILIGDAGDGVPSIKDQTQFTPEFISFLKTNNIFLSDVEVVGKLEVFGYLEDKFLETYPSKKIYKPGMFGEKTAEKAIQDGSWKKLIKEKSIKGRYLRNRTLIDLRKIPVEISLKIIEDYENLPKKVNKPFEITDFLTKHQLKEVQKDIQKILI